jgi:hypothetical protein
MEMCKENDQTLYMSFIDLTKAYDLTNRKMLWKVLERSGVPADLVRVIQALHDDMEIFIDVNGKLSEPVSCANGVRQGDVLASILFNIFFSMVIALWKQENMGDIVISSKIDGFLRKNFKNWETGNIDIVQDFLYADDAGLCNLDADIHKRQVQAFQNIAEALGLKLSIKKSETMTVNDEVPCTVEVQGGTLATCDRFVYLGSVLERDADLWPEIKRRIGRAQGAFNALRHVWSDRKLSSTNRVRVYQSSVLSVLMYGSEAWAPTRKQWKKLESFQIRCVRSLAGEALSCTPSDGW